MPFTPREITDKEFLITMRGYERAEVKAFLRAVADDMANLLAEIEASREAVVADQTQRDAFAESMEATMFQATETAESIEANIIVEATEAVAAILEMAQAEAHQTRIEARERSEESLRWATAKAETIIATAQTEAAEKSERMLEAARTRSEALVTQAEACAEQVLQAAQRKASQLEAAHEDLRQRLALTQSILRDLIEFAGGSSAVDGPPPTTRLMIRGEAPREVAVNSAVDSR